jgi:histidinol-phosphate aminotransferase
MDTATSHDPAPASAPEPFGFSLDPLGHQPSGPARGPTTRIPELRAYSVGAVTPAGARRLHLNEFRGELPRSVLVAAEETHNELLGPAAYPTGHHEALAAEVATYVGAAGAADIMLAGGSDEVLRAVLDAAALRGLTTALIGIPGYTHFEHYAALRGLELVTYATGLGTSTDGLEAALRYYEPLLAQGCLVYLCSPNNPTGDLWSAGAVARLAAEHPNSLFLIDEAYVEYASVEAAGLGVFYGYPEGAHVKARSGEEWGPEQLTPKTCASLLNGSSLATLACVRPNIVVSRTFSKAFGLAALRIGYAVGRADVIRALRVSPSPKAISAAAVRAARAALRELPHYLLETVGTRADARMAADLLRQSGWFVLDTPGNFYLVYVGSPTAPAVEALAAAGVLVRDRGDQPGLAGFVRVTAGSDEDNEAVLEAFGQLAQPEGALPQTLYTNKGTIATLKRLTRRTLLILNQLLGTPVWAQGGTLLGMVRHRRPAARPLPPAADSGPLARVPGRKDGIRWRGGIVPVDDDVDLAYLRPADGSDPLAALVGVFAVAGLTLQRNRTDAYYQVGTNAPGEPISPVHIDIFSYHLVGEGTEAQYLLDDPRFRFEEPDSPQAHCNTSFAPDELFPLRTDHAFYDLPLAIPAKSEQVLRRALGEDFMHVMRVRTLSGLVEVPLSDYSPA